MDLSNWMSQLDESFLSTPLINLAIPGSHDSLSYTIKPSSKMSPDAEPPIQLLNKFFGPLVRRIMYNWCVTQKLSATEQLHLGIRYFDLRLATKKGDKSFYIVHGLYGEAVDKPLREIAEFVRSSQGEICIVDFQHFYDFTAEDHARLSVQLLGIFEGLLCPQTEHVASLTIKDLLLNNHKVIIVYRSDEVEEELLWRSWALRTPWPNTMSPVYLVDFLTSGLSARKPNAAFVSQCVLTPSRFTVLTSPWAGIYNKCAVPAAAATLPWLSSAASRPAPLNIAIADFIHDNDAAFPKTVISINKS